MEKICHSEKETMETAATIARTLKGGEIFALIGELGCGKTTFVKGLALGLQITSTITSPTFNLVHRYSGGRLTLVHFDLYRLKRFEELEALDLELELRKENVIAIEWPQLADPILPVKQTRRVEFQEVGSSARRITISFY